MTDRAPIDLFTGIARHLEDSVARLSGYRPVLVAFVYENGHGGYSLRGQGGEPDRAAAIRLLRAYADFLEAKS